MPPKRGGTAKASSLQAERVPNKRKEPGNINKARVSTAAKMLDSTSQKNHSAANDREILSAFRLYCFPRDQLEADEVGEDDDLDDEDEDGHGIMRVADVRRCLTALGLPKPPPDFFSPAQAHISYAHFLALAQTLRDTTPPPAGDDDDNEEDEREDPQQREIDEAFALFTEQENISVSDLKRIAKELRLEVDEKTLKMMIEVANGDDGKGAVAKGVAREDFEDVMRRAGVFG